MKKIIAIILMLLFSAEVNAKRYKVNDVIENQFVMNKKFKLNLPEGKWTVIRSHGDNYYGLASKIYLLVRLENNLAVEYIEIAEMKTAGIFESLVNQAIYEALFKNKYDGCYERPEYFVVKVYKKGSTHNCLVIDHSDVHKDFFTPDDREVSNAGVKKWIRDNNIQLPKVGLSSFHAYFSRLAAGKWYLLSYGIDPKILNAPKNKFISEETSEYHKNNISNYPEHQKIMQKWVSISAKRHIEFENIIKMIERHKLDLSALSPPNSLSTKNLSSDILDQINKLNDLFKSGVLSKDEFEKAKKKILN
ncbi:SHOCT domain-containing protein [Candidatus Pelagibacter sp. Uisw_104]|jgi:hypothetical protein|uniref:SHOCT domain-containing protein n=1 Tax=unclassified Candidatus Pelagibacter TaxID=2647897 RepID=UPI0039E85822